MKTKALARVEIKDADQGLVRAVFSTFNVIDSDGDVTRRGAFTEGAPVVMSAYGHKSWDGQLPIGHGTIHETESEGFADLQFLMKTAHGRDAFETVKELSKLGLQEWSYSLQNVTSERGEFDGVDVRFLNKIDVKEVSPVLVGAGINTRTLDVKSGSTFSEHAASVLAEVGALVERASEVVALRAEKGKPISPASADLLKLVDVELGRLKALIEPPASTTPDELMQEFLRFVALSQGASS